MEVDIGAHCSLEGCHQKDFLPFTCDCCTNVFCLDHRSYPTHQCPASGVRDHRIIHCPLCKSAVQLQDHEDPNETWERHARSACNPSLYASRKKKKKTRCCVTGCKEVLGTSNKVQCTMCGKETCIRHRFKTDHECIRVESSARSSRSKQSIFNFKKKKGNATITTTSEKCPICDKKFRYVSQLVAHVEREHEEKEEEVCPQCHATFPSVEALIRHSEQQHATGQPRVSVGRQRQEGSDCNLM